MNNKFKIIQINGLSGLILALFIVCCIVTGFIVFPAFLCMHAWNFIASYFYQIPRMELLHGTMLWLMIACIYFAQNSHKYKIQFGAQDYEDDEKMKEILNKIKEASIKKQENESIEEHNKIIK